MAEDQEQVQTSAVDQSDGALTGDNQPESEGSNVGEGEANDAGETSSDSSNGESETTVDE